MYGYWDLITFFTLSTIGTWEIIYQIDKMRSKNDLQHQI